MKKDNQAGHDGRAEIGKRESSDSQPYQKVRRAEGFNDGVGSRDQKEIGKKKKSQLFFPRFGVDIELARVSPPPKLSMNSTPSKLRRIFRFPLSSCSLTS